MAKNPKVNEEICIGCGACTNVCPGAFEMGDDGKSKVKKPVNASEEEIQQAIDTCPVHAIDWE